MPRLRDIENVLQKNSDSWLLAMELHGYASDRVAIFRVIESVHTSVYGRESGEEGTQKVAEIDCVLVGDDFFPADDHSAGTFQEGWLYTTSDVVNVGDRVELIRETGHGKRRYQVTALQKIGATKAVFKKYRLSALGD